MSNTNTAQTIAATTLAQLGGTGRLTAMIGAKNFLFDADGAASFRFSGCKTANYAQIKLNGSDLYDVRFAKIGRGYNVTNDRTITNVDAESLRETFERETKLYLSL